MSRSEVADLCSSLICAVIGYLTEQKSVGMLTAWSVKDLSPWFGILGSALKDSSISHSLPSFIIRYGFLYVPCCSFWTQISQALIRVENGESL